jgi:hypothetical protein
VWYARADWRKGHILQKSPESPHRDSLGAGYPFDTFKDYRLDFVTGKEDFLHSIFLEQTLKLPMPSKDWIAIDTFAFEMRTLIQETYRRQVKAAIIEYPVQDQATIHVSTINDNSFSMTLLSMEEVAQDTVRDTQTTSQGKQEEEIQRQYGKFRLHRWWKEEGEGEQDDQAGESYGLQCAQCIPNSMEPKRSAVLSRYQKHNEFNQSHKRKG